MTQEIEVHPAAAVFPMLSDDELAELADDIKANGQLHPILLDGDGVLIDGRNRLAACRLARVEPTFTTFTGDPIALIVSANVSRRHLTKSQRAMALAKLSGLTTQLSAESIGMTHELVRRALYVLNHAPELVAQVEAGASLNQAYQIAAERKRSEQEQDEQRQKRLDYIEQQHEQLVAEIQAARRSIGPAVKIPPEPELTVHFSRTAEGDVSVPDAAPMLGENLDREAAFLARLKRVKEQLGDIAAEPPIYDSWFFEGHVLGVRSWASQVVSMVYGMVETYNAALQEDGQLRRVK